jgi:hypothetical protein
VFRRVSPTPAARINLTTISIIDPRPRSAIQVRIPILQSLYPSNPSPANFAYLATNLTARYSFFNREIPLPSTTNMDQAKLARMQASVRIGTLSRNNTYEDVIRSIPKVL